MRVSRESCACSTRFNSQRGARQPDRLCEKYPDIRPTRSRYRTTRRISSFEHAVSGAPAFQAPDKPLKYPVFLAEDLGQQADRRRIYSSSSSGKPLRRSAQSATVFYRGLPVQRRHPDRLQGSTATRLALARGARPVQRLLQDRFGCRKTELARLRPFRPAQCPISKFRAPSLKPTSISWRASGAATRQIQQRPEPHTNRRQRAWPVPAPAQSQSLPRSLTSASTASCSRSSSASTDISFVRLTACVEAVGLSESP